LTSDITEQGARAPADAPAVDSVRLRNYYLVRAGVAALWVAAAFTVARGAPLVAGALLIAYPAWDAIANLIDARGNGGLARNPPQALNVAVSGITALAVAAEIGNPNAVLGIYGAWAILAGLLQLATGIRRWKAFGAQWAMVLSGAQSALAGVFFLKRSLGSGMPGIGDVAPYAAFGAFYFAISALWLIFRRARSR
jgi:uncharacterized membrane protein HdeD (DUF308 family)